MGDTYSDVKDNSIQVILFVVWQERKSGILNLEKRALKNFQLKQFCEEKEN